MGTIRACEGVIKAGSPTAVTVGEVTGWSLDENANLKKYFKLGNCNEQSKAGAISRTVQIEGKYDPADAGQDNTLLIGQQIAMEIYPGGVISGLPKVTIGGTVETVNRAGSGDDLLTFSATIAVSSYAEAPVSP